ncbi:uncharacterized protein BP5553_10463 [Venustampulla echinocandica]|uniref:Uncharacterized protein n=1 Tax=Venustampulla echinocandica TaxID=2656787 RepID=A0A370T9D4_9HELO|nr:uncharacterized protein BP5553_10463 [Venustampulla echinocandica]RDL30185.1 hypothetical protein BP5553_10463 [Venustampulla echinocandica]
MLLEEGADPDTGCPKPERYINIGHRRVLNDSLWSPEEFSTRNFPQQEAELRTLLRRTRLERRRAKSSKSQEGETGTEHVLRNAVMDTRARFGYSKRGQVGLSI